MAASLLAVTTATPDYATSFNCNRPSGVAAGDVLIAFHTADYGVLSDLGTPTGGVTWQSLTARASGGTLINTKIWWKVAGGSEPGTYGFSQHEFASGVVAIAAVRGARLGATPVIAESGSNTASTTVPTPAGAPAGADDLELRWAVGDPQGNLVSWTPPAGYGEQADLQAENTTGCLATKLLTSAGSTGVLNFTASASVENRMGFTINVASIQKLAPRRPAVSSTAVHRAASW